MKDELAARIAAQDPLIWWNDRWRSRTSFGATRFDLADIEAAEARLERFAPLLAAIFPELKPSRGVIESALLPADRLQAALMPGREDAGRWFVKADHALPVAGSIKARGGVYEVLVHTERLAHAAGLLEEGYCYDCLARSEARGYFAKHRIIVGSTGNLGLSIGLMAAALGFQATVHMSRDAKSWKKAKLRGAGVEVVEHAGNFTAAVAQGRRDAEADAYAYFVDDERSEHLFLGYSVAVLRLERQFKAGGIKVDAEHPLIVYLPCGVGGAPSGITFGLREIFGDHVHCFFAEPTAAPAMLMRLALGDEGPVAIDALGLDGRTEADGLAVGRASELAAGLMAERVSGIYTVRDAEMFSLLQTAHAVEGLKLEPSAAAALAGPARLLVVHHSGRAGGTDLPIGSLSGATHVLWATGGDSMPDEIFADYVTR